MLQTRALVFVVDEGGGNLFQDKTFVLLGLDDNPEYKQNLIEIITEVEGKLQRKALFTLWFSMCIKICIKTRLHVASTSPFLRVAHLILCVNRTIGLH